MINHGVFEQERDFWLYMKLGLKKLLDEYRNEKDKFQAFNIHLLAKHFHSLLSEPAKLLLEKSPIFIKGLSIDTIIVHCYNTENAEELQLLKSWLEQGLFSHAAFPTTENPMASPVIPQEFKQECNYQADLKLLIQSQNLWRLFVGTDKQKDEPPLSYQKRQNGALVAMTKALKLALSDLQSDLDFKLLVAIHEACVQNVQGVNDLQQANFSSPYRDRDETVGFGISQIGKDSNASIDGYHEVCRHAGLGSDYNVTSSRISTVLWGEALKKRLEDILLAYNQNVGMASTKEEKLRLIVDMIGLIERIHPFWDANCRAICIITLLRELVKNDFPFTMLKNPNRFDCYSSHELMQDVIDGFYSCKHILNHDAFENEPMCTENEAQECAELLSTLASIAQDLFTNEPRYKKKMF